MRIGAAAMAVAAFVGIACAPSEPQAAPKQCEWYPGTCKDGAILAPVVINWNDIAWYARSPLRHVP